MTELRGGNIYRLGDEFLIAKYQDRREGALLEWYLSNPDGTHYAVGKDKKLYSVSFDVDAGWRNGAFVINSDKLEEIHMLSRWTVDDLEFVGKVDDEAWIIETLQQLETTRKWAAKLEESSFSEPVAE